MAVYKHDQGVELGSTEKQLQLQWLQWSERDLNPQALRPNHSTTLPRVRSIGAVIEPYCVIHMSNNATKNRVKFGAFRESF